MKVLTLGTVILLPATVLGGIMGMNFQVGLFEHAGLFWAVIGMMLAVAVFVLAMARVRKGPPLFALNEQLELVHSL